MEPYTCDAQQALASCLEPLMPMIVQQVRMNHRATHNRLDTLHREVCIGGVVREGSLVETVKARAGRVPGTGSVHARSRDGVHLVGIGAKGLEEIWDPAGALVGGYDHNAGRRSGKSCAPNTPEAQGVGGLQVWGSRHICSCDQGIQLAVANDAH